MPEEANMQPKVFWDPGDVLLDASLPFIKALWFAVLPYYGG